MSDRCHCQCVLGGGAPCGVLGSDLGGAAAAHEWATSACDNACRFAASAATAVRHRAASAAPDVADIRLLNSSSRRRDCL